MKHFILVFISVFTFSMGFSQSTYNAKTTELYIYDKDKDDWSLYDKNSDVNIRIVVETRFITINAKTPSMYKVYENSREIISTKTLSGYRYQAKDLREDGEVQVDIIRDKENTFHMISIINRKEGLNFRFYLDDIN